LAKSAKIAISPPQNRTPNRKGVLPAEQSEVSLWLRVHFFAFAYISLNGISNLRKLTEIRFCLFI
jgi:hypothetical protein